ncbi:MAG TPA: radical SAM protein [Syntrophobacteraceae bacterium]|nr:radical SAM protein [Syntrophobacteraceae bacterium]
MRAKDISGQAPGGCRTRLSEVLPLDSPFVMQIFPVYGCNFKCAYCIFSVPESSRHFISDVKMMEWRLYRKCIDDAVFQNKIKVLRFVGIGEPLLHKNISEMVDYAVSRDVAHTVELITNAYLLTPEISDSLISAGLTRLVVSLQGTTAANYKQVSNATINFDRLIERLRYFYDRKTNTQVYMKIIDYALDGEEDKQRFYEIFGDLCDTIAIEHAVPIHTGVDFERTLTDDKSEVTQFGLPVSEVHICPQPFFTMQINPDGKVVPCYSFEYPEIMGDCHSETVAGIWNGTRFRKFRRRMLDGSKRLGKVCAECNIIKYRLFPEDVLNDDAERLKAYYEAN